jgi:(S)-citramalyl-CoA lyase
MVDFVARCLLFTPANRPERFAKARDMGADGVIIDMEDAISMADKDSARQSVIEFFTSKKPDKDFLYCLRINSIKTAAGLKDLSAIIDHGIKPDYLVHPKTECLGELEVIDSVLRPHTLPLIPIIETAKGMHHSFDIASHASVAALLFGGADYSTDLGARLEWEPMLMARATLIQAAAAYGRAAIDVPYLHMHDSDDSGIKAVTKKIKAMGYTCKVAIHPKHIKPIIDVLSASPDDVKRATRIVNAYNAANGNACELDGKMIDVPVYRSAKRILDLSK